MSDDNWTLCKVVAGCGKSCYKGYVSYYVLIETPHLTRRERFRLEVDEAGGNKLEMDAAALRLLNKHSGVYAQVVAYLAKEAAP
jgi:hypothetical protein